MIPLSNGRSPRIDHFYATLRSFKNDSIESYQQQLREEDISIQKIRSLGKQILGNDDNNKINKIRALKTFNRSRDKDQKHDNLYDKYKRENRHLDGKLIEYRKQQIIGQNTTSQQKLWKNKKYQKTQSRYQQKKPIKTLNYVKRTDMQAQQIKKVKKEKEKVEKQIKKKQEYYYRNKNQKPNRGLLKRGVQMEMRKSLTIEKTKEDLRQKQMKNVTFFPQRISKDLSKDSKKFMQRLSINELKKLSKQKQLLRKTISSNVFKPYINENKKVESVIKPIWASQEEWKQLNGQEHIFIKQDRQQEQPTMHSTTRITLKNMDELSFMLQ